jgi:hypothetical protein
MLKKYTIQPDEVNELQPVVVGGLREYGYRVFLENTCDLLILRDGMSPLNVELKVRLHSQGQKVPVSAFQWNLFRSVGRGSCFDKTTRVLICDGVAGKYALIGVHDLVAGLTNSMPKSTSYINRKYLDALSWKEPAEAWTELLDWLKSA